MPVPLILIGGMAAGALFSVGMEYGISRATGTTPTRGEYVAAAGIGAIPGTGYVRPGIRILSNTRRVRSAQKTGTVTHFGRRPVHVAGRRRFSVPYVARVSQQGAGMTTREQVLTSMYMSRRSVGTIGKTLAIDASARYGYDRYYGVPVTHLVSGQPGDSQPSRPIRNTRPDTRPSQSEQSGSRGAPTSARTTQPIWAKRSDRANARSRTAAQPFLKRRRYCKRHGKYDLCHLRRW